MRARAGHRTCDKDRHSLAEGAGPFLSTEVLIVESIIVACITGVVALARRVIAGEFGNGDERKRRLGLYYSIVQARVNEMLS